MRFVFTNAFAKECAREEPIGLGREGFKPILHPSPGGGAVRLADKLEPLERVRRRGLVPVESPRGLGAAREGSEALELLRHLPDSRRRISHKGGSEGGLLLQALGEQRQLRVLHLLAAGGLDAVHRHRVFPDVERDLHVVIGGGVVGGLRDVETGALFSRALVERSAQRAAVRGSVGGEYLGVGVVVLVVVMMITIWVLHLDCPRKYILIISKAAK